MKTTREHFGILHDKEVSLFTLDNGHINVRITDFGGIITALNVPDAGGAMVDIVLGFDNLEAYLPGHLHFGAIVGRCANRIAHGRFQLEERTYQLALNEGNQHHLHGGVNGFHRRLWDAYTDDAGGECRLVLERVSPHMEEGYPGELRVRAVYRLTLNNELCLDFFAETDRPTVVNLSGHSYFNLRGHDSGTIAGHELLINAENVTPTGSDLIPTGQIQSVRNGPLDFRSPRIIGEAMADNQGPFDHNYVLKKENSPIEPAAVLKDAASGRVMTVLTSAKCIQFYTGQKIPRHTIGKAGCRYVPHSGLCLEPHGFPNAVNTPTFAPVILKPGELYIHSLIYSFGTVSDS